VPWFDEKFLVPLECGMLMKKMTAKQFTSTVAEHLRKKLHEQMSCLILLILHETQVTEKAGPANSRY
jgi:hypothetical protein